jgi:hypothetical protein
MIIFDGRENVQVRCMAGCDQRDLISELRRRGLWERAAADEQEDRARSERFMHDSRKRGIAMAQRIFNKAQPCAGTPAQHYLERREVWSVARMIDDIRFSMVCPREQLLTPAIIVAMRDFKSSEITAVQRIFLTQDVHGNVIKDGKPMMLGPAGGSAMKLQQLQDGELHVCEGCETGLSIIAMDEGPVWALGSAGAIRAFKVLPGIERLKIWADNDQVGIDAANVCRDRWLVAGRKCRVLEPAADQADANDVWRDRLGRL